MLILLCRARLDVRMPVLDTTRARRQNTAATEEGVRILNTGRVSREQVYFLSSSSFTENILQLAETHGERFKAVCVSDSESSGGCRQPPSGRRRP